jgi:xanthine dehydrogenase D subunit
VSAPVAPTRQPFAPTAPVTGGIGESPRRPDGTLKVKGEFAYSSDLWAEGMLWGATVRSPHPRARIRAIETGAALTMPGVMAVLTSEDVPGRKTYGLEIPDQPVLAWEDVRYQGEPVALVAADHPETARRAAALVAVDYEVLDPLVDPEAAMGPGAPPLHPKGNVLRHIHIRHGDQDAAAEVVVTGEYEVGMQDQAFLGPESGLAAPDGEGGVDLYVSTQWLHVDRDQLAASLGLPPEQVRITLAGVGGAFGAREDLSMQIHACLLALRTGRPVKVLYSREESFFGHVHRHPARLRYEHGATRDGRLVYVKARILLDGGAYASSSTAVCSNAACFAVGPYDVPSATIDCTVVYTDNPPCGAMRGFGAVQTCFAYEAQMDRLAAELGMDPVELRLRNAMDTGTRLPTGQAVEGAAPVADLLRRLQAMPLPEPAQAGPLDLRELPGGVSNVTHGEGVRRGVGYAVGFKNIGYSEGFDDYSTARVRLSVVAGQPRVEVHTAAAEVGQGLVTLQAQIARTELAVERVVVLPADTQVGSAGSSSASRQSWMTGGAVKAACEAVRDRVLELAAGELGHPAASLSLRDGEVVADDDRGMALADLLAGEVVEETREYHHRQTQALDPDTGQGEAHVAFAFAAHRAVVDVDTELGLVKMVEIATTQDVGKAINPQAVEGQIEGGIAQGLGLALMEEIQVADGEVRNPSFTDYLIPTVLDMPPVRLDVLELGHPDSPYGLRGIGEPPTISSTPAIVAAIRAATGRPLTRVPVRPEHIVGVPDPESRDRPAAGAGRAGPPEGEEHEGVVGSESGPGSAAEDRERPDPARGSPAPASGPADPQRDGG